MDRSRHEPQGLIVGGSAGLGAVVRNSLSSGAMARWSVPNGRTFHILGVPLRTGSLYPGNENDAQAYREVNLLARLQAVGCMVNDDGDVTIPSYLPHHSIPPIRSWPGPRIAWDCINERITPYLQQPGHVPLLISCDCSIVGTTQALVSTSGKAFMFCISTVISTTLPPIPSTAKARHPWRCGS